MGPHETKQVVWLCKDDGNGLESIMPFPDMQDVTEIVIDGDNIPYDETYTLGTFQPVDIIGQIVPRRMSRKRFVKLLMAQGYSRNQANAFTVYGRNVGNYGLAYMLLTFSCFS